MSARIKEARQARGWSQQDLAERVRVSQPTIVHWEQGTHTPRNLALARLADVLGVSRQWLQEDPSAQESISAARIGSVFKSSSPLEKYLSTPVSHVAIFDGPLDRDDIEACLTGGRAPVGYIAVALPVLSALGFVINDPALEQQFPNPTIGVIDCGNRTLIDGKLYLVRVDGTAKVRRWGAYPARFEADRPEDTIMVTEEPEVFGRLIASVRQH